MIYADIIRASDTFGLAIRIVEADQHGSRPLRIMRLALRHDDSKTYVDGEWEECKLHLPVDPTLILSDDVLRALLDALNSHYNGAADSRALRHDLDNERGRTDTLIGHLGTVARSLAGTPNLATMTASRDRL